MHSRGFAHGVVCQPAHALTERQVLCDGFGALASLLGAKVEDVAAPRRRMANDDGKHIGANPAQSRDLFRSRDLLSRPPFDQGLRSPPLAMLPRRDTDLPPRRTMTRPRLPQSRAWPRSRLLARRPTGRDVAATGAGSPWRAGARWEVDHRSVTSAQRQTVMALRARHRQPARAQGLESHDSASRVPSGSAPTPSDRACARRPRRVPAAAGVQL